MDEGREARPIAIGLLGEDKGTRITATFKHDERVVQFPTKSVPQWDRLAGRDRVVDRFPAG